VKTEFGTGVFKLRGIRKILNGMLNRTLMYTIFVEGSNLSFWRLEGKKDQNSSLQIWRGKNA